MPLTGKCLRETERMDADSQLKDTLHITISHAVSRMERLSNAADRRCLFHEYKEWLGEAINDEVWAMPIDLEEY